MGEFGLAGAAPGNCKRTTISDLKPPRSLDLVNRNFAPLAPDRVVDCRLHVCLDAVGLVLYRLRRGAGDLDPRPRGKDLAGLIAHHDHEVQYLSVAYSEHLDAAGIKPFTGTVGLVVRQRDR